MKILIFTLGLSFIALSCQKRKEINEWKDRNGRYFSTEHHAIYEGTDTLMFNEIEVIASGLNLSSSLPNTSSINFDVFHKSYNENPTYEYKIQYSTVTAHSFSLSGHSNPQIPFEEFTQGREFYVSFSGNNLTFTIITTDGVVKDILFKK